MPQPIVSQCPFCNSATEVTEISCLNCDVQIRGHFSLSRFDGLATEHLQFMEVFLRCRGVIRDVEAALGISYPTVRGRLDALLNALGFGQASAVDTTAEPSVEPAPDKAARRREILDAISTGAMDAQTGLDALQKI